MNNKQPVSEPTQAQEAPTPKEPVSPKKINDISSLYDHHFFSRILDWCYEHNAPFTQEQIIAGAKLESKWEKEYLRNTLGDARSGCAEWKLLSSFFIHFEKKYITGVDEEGKEKNIETAFYILSENAVGYLLNLKMFKLAQKNALDAQKSAKFGFYIATITLIVTILSLIHPFIWSLITAV